MKYLLSLLALLLLTVSCKDETETNEVEDLESSIEQPITSEIAYANGFKNFDEVNKIAFTFNVKVNDTVRSTRSWKWNPQEDLVELTENGTTFSYTQDEDLTAEEVEVDKKFINDKYWLLFPYELMWSDFDFDQNRSAVAPISQEKMHELTVKYSDSSGYTPGDTYYVYFDESDRMIREWTYESAGGRTLSTTWEDYETFNGITISKMHKSADGSFQLYFTDIAVE